jgi:hypothetical protein
MRRAAPWKRLQRGAKGGAKLSPPFLTEQLEKPGADVALFDA